MCQHHIFILHDKRCQKCIFPSCLRLAKVVELNFNFFKSIIYYKFSKTVMDTQMINNITTNSFWFFLKIAQILLLQVFLRKISCSLITLLKNIQSDQTIVPTPIRGEEMMIIGLTISHKSKMNRNFTLKKVKMYQTLYVIVLTFAKVSRGLRSVNLFLLRLLTCSTTREKWDMALRPSLACNESSTS